MTGANHMTRAIAACRRAGLPVVEQDDCTCGLRGRLVVLAGPGALRVIWPYEQRCPIHSRHDRGRRRPAARAGDGRSRSTAAREVWAAGDGDAPVIAPNPLNQAKELWPALVEVLTNVKHAAVILSGYPCNAAEHLGWTRIDLEHKRSVTARARSTLAAAPETIWLNPIAEASPKRLFA